MSAVMTPEYTREIAPEEMTLTNEAAGQLASLFEQVDDDEVETIRIYVAGGGCSGMTYGMTFADAKSDFDKVLTGDGFSIYVDSVAISYLKGVEIDYITRDTGATFVFNNVFQTTGGSGTCGACGAATGAGGGCG